MSRVPQTIREAAQESFQEKYPYIDGRDSVNLSYPYNTRYIQGEPNYPSCQSSIHNTLPLVTSIAPHEMHRSPYPPVGMRPSMMQGSRKAVKGESEYVKRPRRRAEEVERLYSCTWPGCDKSYGALNHLNTHVRNADHGPKREPKGTITP
jgi:hypothetical protein